MRVARSRQIIGVVTLVALAAILAGVTGFEVSLPRPGGGTERAVLPGVRAVAAAVLVRVGSGAPAGGELAFLAVEPSGNLVVSDSRRHSVLRFDASGHLLSEWGPRFDEVTLTEPAGVAVYEDNFYVVDRGTPRIFRLDTNGRRLATLSLENQGTYGLNGLTVDAGGNLYAADTGRNRILVITPNGQILRQIGRGGTDLGGFTQPMMVAFAPDGGFFVADWENTRIQRWSPAFEATHAFGTGFRPFGVAVDQMGRVFVPDNEHRRVLTYTPQGTELGELGGAGSPAIEVAPRQVAIARGQRLSLYAMGGDGIVRLDLENTSPPPQGSADPDLLSVLIIGAAAAFLILAVASRRARRARAVSVGSSLDGPIGLHAEDRAQRQHQQTNTDQHPLVAHQAEREQ